MNKLHLPGRVWVASDVHLGPDVPATVDAFLGFLEQASRQADTLILAGDMFDAWIGDDVALDPKSPAWLQKSLHALRETAATLPLWLGHGNRDFLIGQRLLHHLGAHRLPEPVLLETDAGEILLAHGDIYCTADPGYQRARRIVRTPAVQRAYLALPLRTRKAIAAWARNRSMQANQFKAPYIMDVEPSAIESALREADAKTLIHGHTHRPGRHTLSVDGQRRERLVLPDWDFDHAPAARGGWIAIEAKGIQLFQYGPAGFQPDPDQASK